MPDLKTTLHLDMLQNFKKSGGLLTRLLRAVKKEIRTSNIYGLEWGDPDVFEPLKFVRDRYVLPYVNSEHCALEIGPGGGRWTRYMLGFKRLYVVDYHSELLEQLSKNFNMSNMTFIKNEGADFPGIEDNSIDYVFSFGTFVHLDLDMIEAYLKNMARIVKKQANIVIQYADKTKIMGQLNKNFSDNRPDKMRQMAVDAGFKILEEDLTTLWHSSLIRFTA